MCRVGQIILPLGFHICTFINSLPFRSSIYANAYIYITYSRSAMAKSQCTFVSRANVYREMLNNIHTVSKIIFQTSFLWNKSQFVGAFVIGGGRSSNSPPDTLLFVLFLLAQQLTPPPPRPLLRLPPLCFKKHPGDSAWTCSRYCYYYY